MGLHLLTVAELKEKAKSLGLKAIDSLKKAELIEKIETHGKCPVTKDPCEKSCASDECKAEIAESSSEKSDYASHPKFAKFNSQAKEQSK